MASPRHLAPLLLALAIQAGAVAVNGYEDSAQQPAGLYVVVDVGALGYDSFIPISSWISDDKILVCGLAGRWGESSAILVEADVKGGSARGYVAGPLPWDIAGCVGAGEGLALALAGSGVVFIDYSRGYYAAYSLRSPNASVSTLSGPGSPRPLDGGSILALARFNGTLPGLVELRITGEMGRVDVGVVGSYILACALSPEAYKIVGGSMGVHGGAVAAYYRLFYTAGFPKTYLLGVWVNAGYDGVSALIARLVEGHRVYPVIALDSGGLVVAGSSLFYLLRANGSLYEASLGNPPPGSPVMVGYSNEGPYIVYGSPGSPWTIYYVDGILSESMEGYRVAPGTGGNLAYLSIVDGRLVAVMVQAGHGSTYELAIIEARGESQVLTMGGAGLAFERVELEHRTSWKKLPRGRPLECSLVEVGASLGKRFEGEIRGLDLAAGPLYRRRGEPGDAEGATRTGIEETSVGSGGGVLVGAIVLASAIIFLAFLALSRAGLGARRRGKG